VTKNAKIFNPSDSIYYAEADRIEAWGLDHISKAASTVIQYETDWTIDVEQDDDEQPINVDQDEDYSRGTPMDVDGSIYDERSGSVAPSQPAQMTTRRGLRGPYRREKHASSNPLSETLDPDGGLPGSKDGIGAFPSGSDWAKTMLALKLKGSYPCCQALAGFSVPFQRQAL
jgi:bromodomain-containing protein 7/9